MPVKAIDGISISAKDAANIPFLEMHLLNKQNKIAQTYSWVSNLFDLFDPKLMEQIRLNLIRRRPDNMKEGS